MPMNGIEKIAGRIISDARAEADAVRQEAEFSANEIRRQARQDADSLKAQLIQEGSTEAEALYARLVAAADTDAKKAALAVKQELLGSAFALAVDKLRALPDRDYIRLLASLADKASETGQEQLILNADDRDKYGEAIVTQANAISGKSLTLSEETRPIVGGLILSQGRIEVNCTLDALAAQSRTELSAEAAKRLFQ